MIRSLKIIKIYIYILQCILCIVLYYSVLLNITVYCSVLLCIVCITVYCSVLLCIALYYYIRRGNAWKGVERRGKAWKGVYWRVLACIGV